MERAYARKSAPKGGGSWPWMLQRVTGLAVGVLLFLHLWIKHFGNPGKIITFSGSAERLHDPLWLVIGLLMAAMLLFHSFNGARNILLDYLPDASGRRVLFWSFLGAGIIFFFVYLFFLIPFIR